MILSSTQEKEDFEYVERYWSDYRAMTYGRFDICDMEGNMDYSAARRFTDERLEEIRKVEAEISTLCEYFPKTGARQWKAKKNEWSGILAREKSALAELKKGMKI
jgi:hypothetical protein